MMSNRSMQRPKVGDECWYVRWCTVVVYDDAGCVDLEKCIMRTRRVATKADAQRAAREVYPLDRFGAVAYWPARFTPFDEKHAALFPHTGEWKDTAEEEYYEGEAP
jgi:hypothetical protein